MNKPKHFRTDFLFSKNSFLTGVGSVLNIPGNYYKFNSSKSGVAADRKAVASDWGVVGNDIRNAVLKVTIYIEKSDSLTPIIIEDSEVEKIGNIF